MKRSILLVLTLLLLLACANAGAQQRVVIGSTSENVEKAYGPAVGYIWRGISYLQYPDTTEPVYAIYRRKDGLNEYEFRISYWFDSRDSHLHPVARVSTITLMTDQPIQIRGMLERLGWAKDFCYAGCVIHRLIPGEKLLLTQKGDRSFTAMTLAISTNTAYGQPIQRTLRDLESEATVFQLAPFDYSTVAVMRKVKGGWIPSTP